MTTARVGTASGGRHEGRLLRARSSTQARELVERHRRRRCVPSASATPARGRSAASTWRPGVVGRAARPGAAASSACAARRSQPASVRRRGAASAASTAGAASPQRAAARSSSAAASTDAARPSRRGAARASSAAQRRCRAAPGQLRSPSASRASRRCSRRGCAARSSAMTRAGARGRQLPAGLVEQRHLLPRSSSARTRRTSRRSCAISATGAAPRLQMREHLGGAALRLVLEVGADGERRRGTRARRASNGSSPAASVSTRRPARRAAAEQRLASASAPPACTRSRPTGAGRTARRSAASARGRRPLERDPRQQPFGRRPARLAAPAARAPRAQCAARCVGGDRGAAARASACAVCDHRGDRLVEAARIAARPGARPALARAAARRAVSRSSAASKRQLRAGAAARRRRGCAPASASSRCAASSRPRCAQARARERQVLRERHQHDGVAQLDAASVAPSRDARRRSRPGVGDVGIQGRT